MQKINNGIASFSGVVALSVVGVGGYVFIRKDAIIDSVKEKVMDAVMPDIGGGSANISKKDMEFLIAKASETAPAQTIRIESGPVKIVPDTK